MSTRLGLISDVHAAAAPLQAALSLFAREKVDKIICAGDTAGYFQELDATIDLLIEHDVATIIGNHDQAHLEKHADEADTRPYRFFDSLPETRHFEIEDRQVYVVHAHPPSAQHGGIKLLDVDGNLVNSQVQHWEQQLAGVDYDVLIVGHTHQVFAEQLGDVLVVNPGSTQFNHTCMILTLPEMTVETHALLGKTPLKSWNWGKFIRGRQE